MTTEEHKCTCGAKATVTFWSGDQTWYYCDGCNPDPDIDESNRCYSCGKKSHRSEYVGSGFYLGVCPKCDDGHPLDLTCVGLPKSKKRKS